MDHFDVHDEINDSDEYDDFFFESIQRYNTLQMFNLEHVPYHLFQIDETSLCVTSKHSKGNSEVLKLQLPVKLMLPPEKESRCKENDFKVLSLLYTENLVYKINKFGKPEKIITSEFNDSGLKIYTLNNNSLDENVLNKLNIVPWSAPDFVIIEEKNSIICSKCISEPLIQIDVSAGDKIKEIKHPFPSPNILSNKQEGKGDYADVNSIRCQVLSSDLVAVLNTHSANLVLHDLRTDNCFTYLPRIEGKYDKEIWTISDSDSKVLPLDYFGILSNSGSFCIYEKRKNSILIQSKNNKCPVNNYNNLKLKFCEKGGKFSISGINSVVDVFEIKENDFNHVFTHNGHCPNNLFSNCVTDHIWLSTIGKELVVSVCDNKTLNCWDFKV